MQKVIVIVTIFILGVAVGFGGYYLYTSDRPARIEELDRKLTAARREFRDIQQRYERELVRAENALGERERNYIELRTTLDDLERELKERTRYIDQLEGVIGRESDTIGDLGGDLSRAREILARYIEATNGVGGDSERYSDNGTFAEVNHE